MTEFELIFGCSEAMKKVIDIVRRVSGSELSILIQGEAGVGKSFIAGAIHNLSGRAKGPFVTMDMLSIPKPFLNRELFGYEKCPFPGPYGSAMGFLKTALCGTLVLEEIQLLPRDLQRKLIRILEERRYYPDGCSTAVEVDTRLLCTSRSDLRNSSSSKKLLKDFYYRLCECVIEIPPLRMRPEDIEFLGARFLFETCKEAGLQERLIAPKTLSLMKACPWPGNIRQLKGLIRQQVLSTGSGDINTETFTNALMAEAASGSCNPEGGPEAGRPRPCKGATYVPTLKESEKEAVQNAIAAAGGNRSRAARMLGINYRTMLRKLETYDISVRRGQI